MDQGMFAKMGWTVTYEFTGVETIARRLLHLPQDEKTHILTLLSLVSHFINKKQEINAQGHIKRG